MSTLLVNDISNYSGSTIDITVPTVTASGDLTVAGVVTGDTLDAVDTATTRTNLGLDAVAETDVSNTFSVNQIISVSDNTNAALRITQTGSGNALVVEDSTNPDATPFVVDADGNVGIGTNAPQVPVDCNGMIRVISKAGAYPSTGKGLEVYYESVGDVGVVLSYDRSSSAYKPFQINGSNINLFTNGIERMRIDSGGNVGIGTTSPAQKLDVTGNINATGNIVVGGNLTVNGTTTTINSTVTTLDDPIITLGGDTAPATDDNKDRGVEFRWHNGASAKVGFFGFDDSTGRLTFIPDATNSSEVFSGTKGDLDVANIYGTIQTASQTNITGVGTITTGTWAATDVAVSHGGTGASTAAGARTNLGLAIGTNVQAYDSNLTSFVNTFTLPTSDGTSSQVLTTNGSGTLSFQDAGGGVSATTLSLAGDASGSTTIGGGTATLTVAVANDSHTHDGRYYTESEIDTNFYTKTQIANLSVGTFSDFNVDSGNLSTGDIVVWDAANSRFTAGSNAPALNIIGNFVASISPGISQSVTLASQTMTGYDTALDTAVGSSVWCYPITLAVSCRADAGSSVTISQPSTGESVTATSYTIQSKSFTLSDASDFLIVTSTGSSPYRTYYINSISFYYISSFVASGTTASVSANDPSISYSITNSTNRVGSVQNVPENLNNQLGIDKWTYPLTLSGTLYRANTSTTLVFSGCSNTGTIVWNGNSGTFSGVVLADNTEVLNFAFSNYSATITLDNIGYTRV